MDKARCIDVYRLPIAANICEQELREVTQFGRISLAHVTMNPRGESLLHQHDQMHEVYFFLNGNGIITHGHGATVAQSGTYVMIPPKTPHKVENLSEDDTLEHLVIASPAFDPTDVEVLTTQTRTVSPRPYIFSGDPITAQDGVKIYEYLGPHERETLKFSLAAGVLSQNQQASPHSHKKTEELFYVTRGSGVISVGKQTFKVKSGSIVLIPIGAVHSLENTNTTKCLEVLAVSSPAFDPVDFYLH